MDKNKLPYGTQFTPGQINLKELLDIVYANDGSDDTKSLINDIIDHFFSTQAEEQRKNLASNCRTALVGYQIIVPGGGTHMTSFGRQLHSIDTDMMRYEMLAKHILLNLNGMALIEAIRDIERTGYRVTNESIVETLNSRGFCLSKTGNAQSAMKNWLEKGGVLSGWRIDENKLNELTGLSDTELDLLRTLKKEQYYFFRALCNLGSENFQKATDIRNLAMITYGISFSEKSFGTLILNPLETRGLIEIQRTTVGRGAKSPFVRITDLAKKEVVLPFLEQIEKTIGKEIAAYYQKTLEELREEIDSEDTYVKGIALEAFAIKMMNIIGLEFVSTRLKGSAAVGAEVDVIFESTRLLYSRWQVQCKNTSKVSIDQVAKEVGLSHVLNTNAIVIVTTGLISENARQYAIQIMKQTNLCILMVEGKDIQKIIENPTNIIDVFNRESLMAKHIKILQDENE